MLPLNVMQSLQRNPISAFLSGDREGIYQLCWIKDLCIQKYSLADPLHFLQSWNVDFEGGSPELGHGLRPSYYSYAQKWHDVIWLNQNMIYDFLVHHYVGLSANTQSTFCLFKDEMLCHLKELCSVEPKWYGRLNKEHIYSWRTKI